MTKNQFEKKMRETAQDVLSDNPEADLANMAYDLADCALYDPEVEKFCNKEWPGRTREQLKEIIADYIAG